VPLLVYPEQRTWSRSTSWSSWCQKQTSQKRNGPPRRETDSCPTVGTKKGENNVTVPEIIRQAIEIGQRNGKMTFGELDLLCGGGLEAKDIERILNALSNAGIWLEEG
jgi:hypothetical protein